MESTAEKSKEKMPLTVEQAQEFVKHNLYRTEGGNLRSRCVDGRYVADASGHLPPLARPGGDAGYIMEAITALRELDIPIDKEKLLNAVESAVGGIEQFSCHTDEHAEHEGGSAGAGCGHLAKAQENPQAYSLKPGDMEFIFATLAAFTTGSHQARYETLRGEHNEQAVFVIEGEGAARYGIRPTSERGMAFIYHKALDAARRKKLATSLLPYAQNIHANLNIEDIERALTRASDTQRTATLERLASELPVYSVTIGEDGEVTVHNGQT